ncbi:SURF1 family protein [Alteromonas ponticola]|uniref:SURF1-like protein n=1 Tax=Alteromonas aquimaris TaxID=2998417 RepID=A0ABT3P8D9_9ALTE|nr:SURF1 family protein [Alteromonas aquimaris]MCW8108994.1 SURF1 family protein [Alteromonas aquimaris]
MLLTSPRSYIAFGVCILAVVAMLGLGVWQLDRMNQKQQRLASIAQKEHLGIIPLAELDRYEDIRDAKVGFTGQTDNQRIFLLDNQIYQGRVGYQVMAPIETNFGTVLANFGWIEGSVQREVLPTFDLPETLSEFTGYVHLPSKNPFISETATIASAFPMVIQQVELETLGVFAGKSFLPFTITIDTPDDPQFVQQFTPVVMPPEKHFAYAFQWFGLATAAVVIIFVVFFKQRESHDQIHND